MGFGHRVYRAEDPRARVLRRTARELGSPRVEVAERARAGGARGAAREVARPRRSRRTSSSGPPSCSTIAEIPPADVPGDVRLRARRRLVGAHPRAAAHRPADPAVGALRRARRAHSLAERDARRGGGEADALAEAGRRAGARRSSARSGTTSSRRRRARRTSASARSPTARSRSSASGRRSSCCAAGSRTTSPACRGSALLVARAALARPSRRRQRRPAAAARARRRATATTPSGGSRSSSLRNGSAAARHDRDPRRARRRRRGRARELREAAAKVAQALRRKAGPRSALGSAALRVRVRLEVASRAGGGRRRACRARSSTRSAWPSISWTLRRSAPPSSRCVANEWRSRCGWTRSGSSPAFAASRRRIRNAPERVSGAAASRSGRARAGGAGRGRAGRGRGSGAAPRPPARPIGTTRSLPPLPVTRTSAVVEVDAALLEPDRLRDAQPGAVEQLDERPVAQRARRACRSPRRSAARPRPARASAAACACGAAARPRPPGCRRARRAAAGGGRSVRAAAVRRASVAGESPSARSCGRVALEVVDASPPRPARRGSAPSCGEVAAGRRRPCAAPAAPRAARGTPSTLRIGAHERDASPAVRRSGPRVGAVVDPAQALRARRGCRSGSSRARSGRAAPGSCAGRRRPRAGASRTRGAGDAGAARAGAASRCRGGGRAPRGRARRSHRGRARAARRGGSGRPSSAASSPSGTTRSFAPLPLPDVDELLLEVDVAEVEPDRLGAAQPGRVDELDAARGCGAASGPSPSSAVEHLARPRAASARRAAAAAAAWAKRGVRHALGAER